MKSLVAGDDEVLGRRIRDYLVQNGLDCPETHVVTLEIAADRAGRLSPQLVVVILGEETERSLLALREICRSVEAYTVVVGPGDNSKLILRTMHEGAHEYLDEALLEQELADALVRFKLYRSEASLTQEQRGRVISVVAPSGGSGSSTVAVNVSAALAKKHGTCGLIDLRLTTGDLSSLLDVRPQYNLSHLSDNLDHIDAEMLERLYTRHAGGIHLLGSPADFSQASRVSDRAVRQAIAMSRRRFPYVVVDVDNSLGDAQIEALWQSEIILIVLRLDFVSLRNSRRMIDHLRQLGLDLDHIAVVINRYGERKQITIRQAEESLGRKIVHYIPNDPSRINTAINAGMPVVLQRPLAKVSRRISALAASVNGLHQAAKPAQKGMS